MGVQFAGNILVQSNGGPLPISMGGTGQTTSTTAINALLPVQTGQNGKVLTTNGSTVTWSASAGGAPGGGDTNVQFNDAGTFGGNANLVINKATGALTSAATFTGTGNVISGLNQTVRAIKYQTAGSDRWLMQANNADESGSNLGSDFEFVRVADNGLTQNQVYTIARNASVVDFKSTPTVNGVAIGTGSGTVTSVAVSGGTTGLTTSGGPVTGSGTITLAGTLAAVNGGTGASVYTVGDILYASSSSALSKLAASTSGFVLTAAGAGNAPSWAAVPMPATNSTTTLFNAPLLTSVTNSGVNLHNDSNYPGFSVIAAASSAGNKITRMYLDRDNGAISWAFGNDAVNSFTTWLNVSRSANTATGITFTGTAFNLAVGTGGLQLNGVAGTNGQVLTSRGASLAPTWQDASALPSTITTTNIFTGQLSTSTAASYAAIGNGQTGTNYPSLKLFAASAPVDNRAFVSMIDRDTGALILRFINDANSTANDWLTVGRSGNTAASVNFTTTDFNVTATNITLAGTMDGTLKFSGQTPSGVASNYVGIGTQGSGNYPGMIICTNTAPVDNRISTLTANRDGNGDLYWRFNNDALTTATDWMNVGRSGNTATSIKFTSTAFNIAVGTGGLQLNGAAGTSGQVLTSNGASLAPTWQTPAAGAAAAGTLTGTTLAANVVSSSLTSVGTLSSLVLAASTVQIGPWVPLTGTQRGFSASNSGTHMSYFGIDDAAALTFVGSYTNSVFDIRTNNALRFRFGTSGELGIGGATYGTAGQVLTSSGAGAAPTWATAASSSTLPRVTSITSAVVGKRAAVSTNQTVTATTWSGGGSIAVGDIYSIYNDSGSAITVSAGAGLTMYKDGTSTSVGSVTLAARGSCTVWYNTVSEVVINGSIV